MERHEHRDGRQDLRGRHRARGAGPAAAEPHPPGQLPRSHHLGPRAQPSRQAAELAARRAGHAARGGGIDLGSAGRGRGPRVPGRRAAAVAADEGAGLERQCPDVRGRAEGAECGCQELRGGAAGGVGEAEGREGGARGAEGVYGEALSEGGGAVGGELAGGVFIGRDGAGGCWGGGEGGGGWGGCGYGWVDVYDVGRSLCKVLKVSYLWQDR